MPFGICSSSGAGIPAAARSESDGERRGARDEHGHGVADDQGRGAVIRARGPRAILSA
ncbi:MAG: hypothetical protein WBJ20_02290 [Candidatus Methanoculleus thermohydrogenotrophicum]